MRKSATLQALPQAAKTKNRKMDRVLHPGEPLALRLTVAAQF
jgi:hypothetical protein